MIWTNEYLNRLKQDAEIEISKLIPCVIDRFSIATSINVSEYQLPEYVQDITRVFWKGQRLEAIPSYNLQDWGYSREISIDAAFEESAFTSAYQIGSIELQHSFGTVGGGKPMYYWYSKFGENVIRVLPAVNEELLSYDLGLWGENITNSLIVEFYRVADGVNHKIPEYIRRRTVKAFVLSRAFQKEGVGQNLKAAQYWQNKYALAIKRAELIINHISQALIRSRYDTQFDNQRVPARPVLPWNWQVVNVEDDYDY